MSKKDAQPELVPRLRFPEFRASDGWANEPLGEIVALEYGSPLPATDRTGDRFPVVGSNGVIGYHETATVSGPAIVIGRKGSVGQINLIEDDCTPIDTTFHVVPKRPNRDDFYFVWRILEASRLHTFGDAGAVPGLSRNDVYARRTAVPNLAEQRKIAACLGSLDDLIAAEGRKLAALRDHKKGLMQQLFPGEGETRPRLRFPEFKDAPEWESKELGPMTSKVGSGITPRGGSQNYKDSGRPFIRSQNVGWGSLILDDVVHIDEETHASFDGTEIQLDDVLLNISGASIGRCAVADERVVGGNVNQHVCIIRTDHDSLLPLMLSQSLISEIGQKQIDQCQAGGNRQGLNFGQTRSFLIPVPPLLEEQHRIAESLSSLDAMIAGQAEKLDGLRTHKRGLMQQLFASPGDAEA